MYRPFRQHYAPKVDMKQATSQEGDVLIPSQCRAARALVEITREELAAAAKVAVRTIADFETGKRQPIVATRQAMRAALEAAGVAFVAPNGEGPGVRLRRRQT
jgi:transcriptional regulator with XRE-family HTH domain